MKAQTKAAKFMRKVLYITRHGINLNSKAHQGAQECQRRVAQGRAGEHYVHGAQYHE